MMVEAEQNVVKEPLKDGKIGAKYKTTSYF